MIPTSSPEIIGSELKIVPETSKTYAIKTDNDNNKQIKSYIDEIDAIKQTIYLILNIERYDYIMYSRNYGIELADLFGREKEYVIPELQRRITEALISDDRIEAVDEFSFEIDKNNYTVTFVVTTIFGKFDLTRTVVL